MKLIISADDGSESAERAVAFAADLAKAFSAKLLIVHIGTEKFSEEELVFLDRVRVTEGDALEAIDRRILQSAREIAKKRGVEKVETVTATGDPAKKLIEIAKSEHADAIVAGRRGLGMLEGLLLGSVSQKLSSLAPCAVVVMP